MDGEVLKAGFVRGKPSSRRRADVREELGCAVGRLAPVAEFSSAAAERKRDTIFLFEALAVGQPVADGWEVEEAVLRADRAAL